MSGLIQRSFFIMDNLKQSLLFCINKNPVLKLFRLTLSLLKMQKILYGKYWNHTVLIHGKKKYCNYYPSDCCILGGLFDV